MIQLSNIKLHLDESESKLKQKIAKKLRISPELIMSVRIAKKSLDARKKDQIHFTYSVKVELKNEKKLLLNIPKNVYTLPSKKKYETPESGNVILKNSPIVIGSGPAGLMAGYILAKEGYKPMVIERGSEVDQRSKDIEKFWNTGVLKETSNVQFGEGGAGTFSDGKLTTGIKDIRCKKVLELFVEAGAPKEILYDSKPHIGTDVLKKVVKNIRESIIAMGGKVVFDTKVENLIVENGLLNSIILDSGEKIDTEVAVLAIGHSARDTFEMLFEKGIDMSQKPFAVGVRIEHPQNHIDKIQYGKYAQSERLGAADYKQVYHGKDGRRAHTFCMCPGGLVVAAASENGRLVTNGMSEHARDAENANSAILVPVDENDFGSNHVLAGMYFQRKLEERAFVAGGSDYKAPAQKVGDLLKKRKSTGCGSVKPSYRPGVKWTELESYLTEDMAQTIREAIVNIDKRMKGFAMPDAVLTGVESRSSSPVRIIRDQKSLESTNCSGLYPCGEGAGYAGGIMSAAVDGIKVADRIIENYRKFD